MQNTESLALDFTGLFAEEDNNEAQNRPSETFSEGKPIENTLETQKPIQGKLEGLEREQAKQLYIQAEKERSDKARIQEYCKEYQENIKRSSELQGQILKGLRSGEDIYSLFLKAAEAISRMTNNKGFYRQAEQDLREIYGKGLDEDYPLELELEAALQRLQKLRTAEEREAGSSLETIRKAIKSHEKSIEELTKRTRKPQQ